MNCEASVHSDKCNGEGTTEDHFTPKSILRLTEIKDTMANHQWLSPACHLAKDKDTPLRAQVLRLEKKGVIFTFNEHRQIFETGYIGEYKSRITKPDKRNLDKRRR